MGSDIIPVIETLNITKIFKMGKQELQVLFGISITIRKGEYVALMGPSGWIRQLADNIISMELM